MNCLATRGLRPPGTDGEGFGLGQQLVVGHLDAVLFGKLGEDDLEPGFLRPLEGDGEAEPGRKAHQLLTGVGLVDVVAGAVGEGLLDEVAAVGGSVNGDVPALPPTLPSRMAFRAAKLSSLAVKLKSSMKRMNFSGFAASLSIKSGI